MAASRTTSKASGAPSTFRELEAKLLLKKEEMESLGEETTKLRSEVPRYKTMYIS